MEKIHVIESGCWLWTGFCNHGYGRFAFTHEKAVAAHRWSYEHFIGPIPEGLTIDHLCHSNSACSGGNRCPHRRCVNPEHLEPVTPRENVLRGNTPAARNALKTHCPYGHEYTPENTKIDRGMRSCRECLRIRARQYRRRKREDRN